MRLTCPCGASLRVPEAARRRVRCPRCRAEIDLPDGTAGPPAEGGPTRPGPEGKGASPRAGLPRGLVVVYCAVLVPTMVAAAGVVIWEARASVGPTEAAPVAADATATPPGGAAVPPTGPAAAGRSESAAVPAAFPPPGYESTRRLLKAALGGIERSAEAGARGEDEAVTLRDLAADFAEAGDAAGVARVRDLIDRLPSDLAAKYRSDLDQAAVVAAVVAGDRSAAEDHLRRSLEEQRDLDVDAATAAGIAASVVAARLTAAGDLAAADRHAGAFERAAGGLTAPASRAAALGQAASLRLLQGRADEAARLIGEVRRLHDKAGTRPPRDEFDLIPALLAAAGSADETALDRLAGLGPDTPTWPRAVDLGRKLLCERRAAKLDLAGARRAADRIKSALLNAEATVSIVRRTVEASPDAGWRRAAMAHAAAAVTRAGSAAAVAEAGRPRAEVEREWFVRSTELLAAGGEDALIGAMGAEFDFSALPPARRLGLAVAQFSAADRRGDDSAAARHRARAFGEADAAAAGDGAYLLGIAAAAAEGADAAAGRVSELRSAVARAGYLRGVAAAERDREWARHAARHGLVLQVPGEPPRVVRPAPDGREAVGAVTASLARTPLGPDASLHVRMLGLGKSGATVEPPSAQGPGGCHHDADRTTFVLLGTEDGLVVAFPGTYAGLRGGVSCATSGAFGEEEQRALLAAVYSAAGERIAGGRVEVRKHLVWGRSDWVALDVRRKDPSTEKAAGPAQAPRPRD